MSSDHSSYEKKTLNLDVVSTHVMRCVIERMEGDGLGPFEFEYVSGGATLTFFDVDRGFADELIGYIDDEIADNVGDDEDMPGIGEEGIRALRTWRSRVKGWFS